MVHAHLLECEILFLFCSAIWGVIFAINHIIVVSESIRNFGVDDDHDRVIITIEISKNSHRISISIGKEKNRCIHDFFFLWFWRDLNVKNPLTQKKNCRFCSRWLLYFTSMSAMVCWIYCLIVTMIWFFFHVRWLIIWLKSVCFGQMWKICEFDDVRDHDPHCFE